MRDMLGVKWTITSTGGRTLYWTRSVMRGGRRVQVYQHRIVMEARLGRSLGRDELVHHIDGDGLNNSLANLEIVSALVHKALHRMDKKEYALVCAAARACGLKPGAFVAEAAEAAAVIVIRQGLAELGSMRQ